MKEQKCIAVFFEGDRRLRPGLSEFLKPLRELARKKEVKIELLACDDKDNAIKTYSKDPRFKTKLLLIDSDGPPPTASTSGWYYMVEVMESWLLADWDRVAEYFHFIGTQATKNKKIENVAKKDVFQILDDLAKPRGKGRDKYHKIDDGRALLERVRLDEVRELNHCDRFCKAVEAAIEAS